MVYDIMRLIRLRLCSGSEMGGGRDNMHKIAFPLAGLRRGSVPPVPRPPSSVRKKTAMHSRVGLYRYIKTQQVASSVEIMQNCVIIDNYYRLRIQNRID